MIPLIKKVIFVVLVFASFAITFILSPFGLDIQSQYMTASVVLSFISGMFFIAAFVDGHLRWLFIWIVLAIFGIQYYIANLVGLGFIKYFY